jgi:hypothetical protein
LAHQSQILVDHRVLKNSGLDAHSVTSIAETLVGDPFTSSSQ